VSLYDVFHRDYGWTVAEIDATELGYLLTLMRVKSLETPESEDLVPIDEVL
jgi:hypothetical protein